MNFIRALFPDELIETIGWTIFHSLWQATLVLIVLLFVLFLIKKYSPRIKYLVAFSGLIITVIISGITAVNAYSYAKTKVEIKENLINNPLEVKDIIKQKLTAESATEVKSSKTTILSNTLKIRAFFQRNFPIVFLLWVLGMFYFLIKLLGGIVLLQQVRNRNTVPLESTWTNKFETIKEQLGIKKSVEYVQSTMVKVPMLLGYFKPVVLLPVSLLTGLNQKEIEAVIAHELAHLKRHDYALNIIQSAIEAIFFYHPAVWLIGKLIRNEREHSCDDLAIQSTGDKLNYIKALAAAQEMSMSTAPNYAVAFSSKGGLLNRVKRIKNQNTMKNNVTEGFIAASIIFFSLILLSFTIDGDNLKHELNSVHDISGRNHRTAQPANVLPAEKVNPDSLNKVIEGTIQEVPVPTEEMEQLMEIAYTYNDEELSELINGSIELALKEFELNEVIALAMQQADSAITKANIDSIIREAMEEAKIEIAMENEVPEIAIEALEIAKTTMEAIDLEGIISLAMQEAAAALEEINMEEIMQEVELEMQASEEEMKRAKAEMQYAEEEIQQALLEAQEALKNSQDIRTIDGNILSEEELQEIKEELKQARIEIEQHKQELEKMAKEMQEHENEVRNQAEEQKKQIRERERAREEKSNQERGESSTGEDKEQEKSLEDQLKELEGN